MKHAKGEELQFDGSQPRGRELPSFAPTSINAEHGTVEATFATSARVLSYHHDLGVYYEELGFEPGMVRMARLQTAAPILDKHKRYDDDLGIVKTANLNSNSISGTLRFDKDDEKGKRAFGKIERGFWKTFSVGYNVYKLRYLEDHADGKPVYMAIDWEPTEVSTAPIAADIDSIVRSEGDNKNHTVKILNTSKTRTMETKEVELTPAQIEAARIEKEKTQPTAEVIKKAERQRIADITELATKHGMDAEFIRTHTTGETKIEEVRTLILDKISLKQPDIKIGNRQDGFSDEKTRAEAMEDGILFRMDAKSFPGKKELEGNPYRHRTLLEMCDEYLERQKLSMDGGARQRVQRAMAFGLGQRVAGMSTSDFPNIFANVLAKTLRKDYEFSFGEWKPFCYRQDATRVNQAENSIQLGDFTAMEKVMEGAEYKRQSVSEGKETFTAYKYGSEFSVTLEMIINDDLGAITRMANKAAQMGGFTEDYVVWSLLIANPTMGDGVAVFHNTHANLGTTGALSATTLGELYTLMRKQTGLNGKVINIKPKYVIVGPAKEIVLDQILNGSFVPTAATGATPSFIKTLKPIVTPYITDNSYYIAADPSTVDTIRYGGVTGEPDFTVEEMVEIKTDSFLHHARKFFGASFTDYRGLAKNIGA